MSTVSMTPIPTQPPAAEGVSQPEFDVFISYCEPDRDWVEAELIEPLRKAEIRVIHQDEFELGKFKLDNLEDAVRGSRRVVIVLSPDWCASALETWTSLLALTPSPEGILRRVIPLIYRPCDLPGRVSMLEEVDFSSEGLRKKNFDRLLRSLGRSSRQINEAATRDVRKGIEALAKLLRTTNAEIQFSLYQESISQAIRLIGILGHYKRLHDYFQQVELDYKLLLRTPRAGTAGGPCDESAETALALARQLSRLVDYAGDSGLPADELLWTGMAERIARDLRAAAEGTDDGKLGKACDRLNHLLGNEPSRLNDRMVKTAGQLALGSVANILRRICAALAGEAFDEEAQGRLGEFTSGIDSLDRLDRKLAGLIRNHNCLQQVDELLRTVALGFSPDPADIAEVWPDLSELMKKLDGSPGDSWITAILQLRQDLDNLLVTRPSDPAGTRALQLVFRGVREKICDGFNMTDHDLLTFCEQLQKVGESLSGAIGRMRYA